MSPKAFEASETDPSMVGAVVCERTKLEGDPGKQVAVGTGETERIPAQLVSFCVIHHTMRGFKSILWDYRLSFVIHF